MRVWHLRHLRLALYFTGVCAFVGVVIASVEGTSRAAEPMVTLRQLLRLWALGLLLTSLIVGPLTSVFPRLPLKTHLMYGRRAIGVMAFAFAVAHVTVYVLPTAWMHWRDLFANGWLWVIGLSLGMAVLIDMGLLAFTSRDHAVKQMGGRKWKRLHRTIYLAFPVALAHAVLNGADFGVSRAPDVTAEPDAGALIGFVSVSIGWLTLFLLRRGGYRWPSRSLPSAHGAENQVEIVETRRNNP